jgi:hypothetical protein
MKTGKRKGIIETQNCNEYNISIIEGIFIT